MATWIVASMIFNIVIQGAKLAFRTIQQAVHVLMSGSVLVLSIGLISNLSLLKICIALLGYGKGHINNK